MLRELTKSGRLPGFLRRRFLWIMVLTIGVNAVLVVLLGLPLGRKYTHIFVICVLASAFVSTLSWILFNAACEKVAKEALKRTGLRCWECGYHIDGLVDPSKCPECGETIETTQLRDKWESFLAWIKRGM